jgi:hypothetical protein
VAASIFVFCNVEESMVDCCVVVAPTVIDGVTAILENSIFVGGSV